MDQPERALLDLGKSTAVSSAAYQGWAPQYRVAPNPTCTAIAPSPNAFINVAFINLVSAISIRQTNLIEFKIPF